MSLQEIWEKAKKEAFKEMGVKEEKNAKKIMHVEGLFKDNKWDLNLYDQNEVSIGTEKVDNMIVWKGDVSINKDYIEVTAKNQCKIEKGIVIGEKDLRCD